MSLFSQLRWRHSRNLQAFSDIIHILLKQAYLLPNLSHGTLSDSYGCDVPRPWENMNLKAAVGREQTVQAIDRQRECKNCMVTFGVMSRLLHFQGTSRGCADFCVLIAVFKMKGGR